MKKFLFIILLMLFAISMVYAEQKSISISDYLQNKPGVILNYDLFCNSNKVNSFNMILQPKNNGFRFFDAGVNDWEVFPEYFYTIEQMNVSGSVFAGSVAYYRNGHPGNLKADLKPSLDTFFVGQTFFETICYPRDLQSKEKRQFSGIPGLKISYVSETQHEYIDTLDNTKHKECILVSYSVESISDSDWYSNFSGRGEYVLEKGMGLIKATFLHDRDGNLGFSKGDFEQMILGEVKNDPNEKVIYVKTPKDGFITLIDYVEKQSDCAIQNTLKSNDKLTVRLFGNVINLFIGENGLIRKKDDGSSLNLIIDLNKYNNTVINIDK